MTGKLFGVGIGPGDPELLTLKAVRIINECDVAAVPGKTREDSVAYQIAQKAVPNLREKEVIAVHMPMTKDEKKLEDSHDEGTARIERYLEEGKSVAFLTLGDPTIYSTYLYIHKRILGHGYEAEIVSGITSFCAAAARMNIGLVEKAEPLHVIPASYQVEEALKLPGTKILMKAGKKLAKVKEELEKLEETAVMVENCGMENERVYRSAQEIPEDAGYYSLMIVKEN